MVRQDLIIYIKQQIAAGYQPETIKNYLISLGNNQQEVLDALEFINNSTGLEEYIQQQINMGYDSDAIQTFLISRGYNSELVKRGISNVIPSSHFSRKNLIILSLILLGLVFVGGLSYIMLTDDNTKVTTTSTFLPVTTTTLQGKITTTRTVGTTYDTTTTQSKVTVTSQTTTTSEEYTTTTSRITFTPETAPLKEVYAYVQDVGKTNPAAADNFCSKVKDRYKDSCYQELSKITSDKKYCSYMTDSKKRDSCYVSFATKLKDYDACQYIENANLKRSCDILKSSQESYEQSEKPVISNFPNINIKQDGDYFLNLNNYVSITSVVWDFSGNVNINVDISSSNLATFKPDIGWIGKETILFKACNDDECDEKSLSITVIKANGFTIDEFPEFTIDSGGDFTLDLNNYIETTDAVEWAVPPNDNFYITIDENSLFVKDLKEESRVEDVAISGCVGLDCDTKIVSVAVIQAATFVFMIPDEQKSLVIGKNLDYSLLLLDNYVNSPGLSYSSTSPEHLSITIAPDSRVTIVPETDWTGEEAITFFACEQSCKNQTMNIRVV